VPRCAELSLGLPFCVLEWAIQGPPDATPPPQHCAGCLEAAPAGPVQAAGQWELLAVRQLPAPRAGRRAGSGSRRRRRAVLVQCLQTHCGLWTALP